MDDLNNNDQISFIMHEVHNSLNSLTSKLYNLTKNNSNLSVDLKKDLYEITEYADNVKLLLNYLQINENPNSFDGVDMRNINIYSVFKNPSEYFKNIMKKKGIAYNVVNLDKIIPSIQALPIIRSVGNILLDNAIKYSPNNSEIECSFEVIGNDLSITVENDGPFVNEDELNLLFKKGYRGLNAIETKQRGYGYGLDFLKTIVEKIHDGEISVNSKNEYKLNGISYGRFVCSILLPIKD